MGAGLEQQERGTDMSQRRADVQRGGPVRRVTRVHIGAGREQELDDRVLTASFRFVEWGAADGRRIEASGGWSDYG